MDETNVSELESEIGVTEDDIPGAKVQMNNNLVPCNSLRRLCKTKLGPGYHSFLKWQIRKVIGGYFLALRECFPHAPSPTPNC